MNKREELIRSIHAAQELLLRRSKTNFKSFVQYIDPAYDMQWFHKVICEEINAFDQGLIKNMMILVPPQHGKSELATRKYPAFALGRNPNKKIAITSYSDTMATGFNRAVQRNIDNEAYAKVFPDTKLNASQIFNTNYDNYSRNEHLFEIVKKKGSLRAVGRGGPLTGNPVDLGIIDDLYKDRNEARSMTVSQGAWEWYIDVFKTRLHNDSQQLIMSTRWDQDDICGRLLREEPEKWVVIRFPAIKTEDQNEYDPREVGEALWPSRHSIEKILDQKKLSQVSFNSLYQQDPKPNTDILIFSNWIEVPKWPTVSDGRGGQIEMEVDTWALDFGKTTGINALIKKAYNGNDIYFDECCYEPGLGTKAIYELLMDNGYNGEVVYCDHQPTKIGALRTIYGVNAIKALKGDGSIDAGISFLKQFNCHYTARSTNLKMELNNYQWVTYGPLITNIPVDEFNHAIDACRYSHYSKYFRSAE